MSTPAQKWMLPALLAALALGGWLWMRRGAEHTAPAPQAAASAAASSAAPAPLSASQVERSVERVRAGLERDPKDAAAWAMLAHSYEMLGRFDDAGKAYQKLLALRPQDAQAHADYADALGVTQRGSLQGAPAGLISKALALDPANLKALVLGGKEAFERKQYTQAVALWERALKVMPDPALRRPVETSIAEARALASPTTTTPAPAAAGLAFVSGRVTVAAALKDRIAPEDTVFIYARPTEGSRMPVALLRKRGRDMPLDFALDDTLAMVPQARLSLHPQVFVGVRVSRRGDAIPAAGDLEGEIGPIKLGATGLTLEISRARP